MTKGKYVTSRISWNIRDVINNFIDSSVDERFWNSITNDLDFEYPNIISYSPALWDVAVEIHMEIRDAIRSKFRVRRIRADQGFRSSRPTTE